MSIRTSPWPAGMPCWADLATPDVVAAKSFYADVLGWAYEDTEDQYGGYALATARGAAAAGIGPLQEGSHTAWTLYLATDDADSTAAAVTEHGGTVLLPPGDVGPLGRFFVAADPTGAVFGAWQAGTHIGAGIVNEPGGLTWDDLRSPDPESARTFYRAVFGHRTEALPAAGPEYTTFHLRNQKAPLGGMGGMFGAPGPAHWVVYFGVADVATTVAAARRGGGSVLVEELETPFGRMAGLSDPAGAALWVVEPDPATQPDRSG